MQTLMWGELACWHASGVLLPPCTVTEARRWQSGCPVHGQGVAVPTRPTVAGCMAASMGLGSHCAAKYAALGCICTLALGYLNLM